MTIAGDTISVKGPQGEITRNLPPDITAVKEDGIILLKPKESTRRKDISALWGLGRALTWNMVQGVKSGFSKSLEIHGVGYRAEREGKSLVLHLGFSHQIVFPVPEGINIKVEGNVIEVSGVEKDVVGQTAANIRALRKPEPYKGKGIRYKGEQVRRKVGKKAATTAAA